MERRRFLRGAVAAALGAVPLARSGPAAGSAGYSMAPASPNPGTPLHGHTMPGPSSHSMAPRLPDRWGVQLYTLRSLMAEDVAGTLEAVADLGYGEVEFAGYFGRSPREIRAILEDLGLAAPSAHVPMEVVAAGLEPVLEAAATLGHGQLVVPWLAPDLRTPEGYRRLADTLNRAGAVAARSGIRLAYHNHDFEFEELPGRDGSRAGETAFEFLVRTTGRERVSFQLDLFWAVHAGRDPLEIFRRYPGRFVSVHAKDRTPDGRMVSVGQGALDFATLLPAAERAGVGHVFVEHDDPADPLASVSASIRHLESLRS